MFPAPTTMPIPTPCSRTAATSAAIRWIVPRSSPYERSPIRASPESFSSTRRKAGVPTRSGARASSARTLTATSLAERVADELDHVDAFALERLADREAGVVDPRLLQEDAARIRGEEALVQHALDDLVAGLLGLALELVGAEQQLALGLDEVGPDVLAANPRRRRGGDVHRQPAGRLLGAATNRDQHADLVRRRVRVAPDRLALATLEPLRTRNDDVLAQLRHERGALVLELLRGLRPPRVDGLEQLLRELEELRIVGDEVGLARERDDRPVVVGDPVADLAFRRLAPRALRGLCHAPLPEQDSRRLDVAAGLLERALAVHHPRAGLVAELLHQVGGNRGHADPPRDRKSTRLNSSHTVISYAV